ncbi:hypothetical protein BDA96_01G432900, partial [Sorghum bicolor]
TRDDGVSPSRSASTIVAASVYHVIKIEGYSNTLEAERSHQLSSCPFTSGGHTWHINYRPTGSRKSNTEYMSFFLVLEEEDTTTTQVMARVTFSLLDQEGNPVPAYTFTTQMCNFSVNKSQGYENFIRRVDLERSGHLTDDSFSVGCYVVVTKEAAASSTAVAPPPPSDMHLHYGHLLSSKQYTDVEFLVGGETFLAHRLVLAARSPVFMAELFPLMNEVTAAEEVVQIDDMEAQAFKALLTFIYTDTLPEFNQHEDDDEMTMIQRLLVAADKYKLQRLKLTCENKLCRHIDIGSVATILVLADKYHCEGLREACFEFLSSSATLSVVVETDGFLYLTQTCPAVLKDLISNIVAHQLERTDPFSVNK